MIATLEPGTAFLLALFAVGLLAVAGCLLAGVVSWWRQR